MLPRLLWKISRAHLISGHLINDEIDILVFREAFDHRAGKILEKGFHDVCPYKIGLANRAGFRVKTNSGIVIYKKSL